MEFSGKLTLEQEFELKIIEEQVKGLSIEQAQDYVVKIMRQMMMKENLFKRLLKDI
ncbi:MAG: NblA/ycf18 family protein [Cyanobacteria bacterium J06638_28]